MLRVRRVAVIGAGPAGLVALRHLSSKPKIYAPIAYEKSSVIGGMWNYSDATVDKNGLPIHSSMYKNMKINTATDLMQFKDFSFARHTPPICGHKEVLQYLENYANHFELKNFIQFETLVTEIKPYHITKEEVIWKVFTNQVDGKESKPDVEIFDAVIVANGVLSTPNIPDIPGLDEFKGKVIHSFDYRVPEIFTGMRVAVLGGLISGQDIAVDVSQSAREVFFCHNTNSLAWDIPKNIRQCVRIERFAHNKAIMMDGAKHEMDAIIFCTGYKKHLPFLSPECRVKIEQERISPLYKHVIHTEYPSLAFIGYNQLVMFFSHSEIQIKFLLAAWEGRYKLPSTDEMNEDTHRDFDFRKSRGMSISKAHHMGFLLKSYQDELAKLGGFEPLSRHHYKMFELNLTILLTGLTFKDYDFKRDETGRFDLERYLEFFNNEQRKSTCGRDEIQRRLEIIKRLQSL